MTASTKKLIGLMAFLPALLLYMGAVLWVYDRLPENRLVAFLFFIVAGTVWAFPLKPVFAWMNKEP